MTDLQQRYAAVLDRLVTLVGADPALIGLYVYGSSTRGDVWEHSDVDAVFVTSEESRPWESYALVADGIQVSAEVCSRSHFRRIHERALRGSATHAIFTSGRLIYASDPTLQSYIDDAKAVGERDRELLRMLHAIELGGILHGAEKALAVRNDLVTPRSLLVQALERKAHIELLERGEPACREAASRIYSLDTEFAALWTETLCAPDALRLRAVHDRLVTELQRRAAVFYKPLLDYLREERVVRTVSEIHRAVGARLNLADAAHGVGHACEALARWGLVQRTTTPTRLARKGRVEFEEAAFFYGGESA